MVGRLLAWFVVFCDHLRRKWIARSISRWLAGSWQDTARSTLGLRHRAFVLAVRRLRKLARFFAKERCEKEMFDALFALKCLAPFSRFMQENLEHIVLMGLRDRVDGYTAEHIIHVFSVRIPESIIRWGAGNDEFVARLRMYGVTVPSDILAPFCAKVAATGDLKKLQLLCGPTVPENLLRDCMQAALAKKSPAALECARILKDYQVIAHILADRGTPQEMLTAQLYLEGKVPERELD